MMPRKNRNAAKVPTREDRYFGERIKEARIANDMQQKDLASLIGVSYQQLQKYESGENRVTTSRVALLVTALNRPLAYFFPNATDVRWQLDPVVSSLMTSKDGQRLVRAYVHTSQKRRKLMVDVAEEFAEEAK
jgi:transcriptional regulator with XRE-family HTH domain